MVGYRRTSTDDQRLGIEAQDATLNRVAQEHDCELVRVFTEHESGARPDRPELDKAIKHARRIKGILVVAKLARLARDSAFLMKLYDGNVPILFADLPEIDGSAASRLMVQMMANIAEFERRRIGERTREALAALKAKGKKLGASLPQCRNLTQDGRVKGSRIAAKNRVVRAVDEMSDVAQAAGELRQRGRSLREICQELQEQGFTTRNGSEVWTAAQVLRVLRRAEAVKV
jgi:DNA invertase Pin-like site-specific DNA recombinase